MMEFYNESHPRARKVHKCEACRREIKPGEVYCRQTGKWEGDFFSRAWCSDCELVMEYYFNRLSSESEFDYDDVEYALQEAFCYGCEHGQRQKDDCERKSLWHCPTILQGIKDYYEQRTASSAVKETQA